jgi:hypothetical protein
MYVGGTQRCREAKARVEHGDHASKVDTTREGKTQHKTVRACDARESPGAETAAQSNRCTCTSPPVLPLSCMRHPSPHRKASQVTDISQITRGNGNCARKRAPRTRRLNTSTAQPQPGAPTASRHRTVDVILHLVIAIALVVCACLGAAVQEARSLPVAETSAGSPRHSHTFRTTIASFARLMRAGRQPQGRDAARSARSLGVAPGEGGLEPPPLLLPTPEARTGAARGVLALPSPPVCRWSWRRCRCVDEWEDAWGCELRLRHWHVPTMWRMWRAAWRDRNACFMRND